MLELTAISPDGPRSEAELDHVFAALADATRRQLLSALQGDGFSLTDFARSRGITLTGVMKHLRVLENAGLVARSKEGRTVRCELSAAPLQEAAVWLSRYEKFWTTRLDALGRYLYHQQEVNPCPTPEATPGPKPRKSRRSSSPAGTTSPRPKSGKRGPTRKP